MGIVTKINYLFLSELSPRLATQLMYYGNFKKMANLSNPKTLNEKICWLKLNVYKNKQLISDCADKLKVRDYVAKYDDKILNEIYGVWNRSEDINWESLPNKFVIKLNHGAGYNIVCKDKNSFDIKSAEKKIDKWLNHDFWKIAAELQYKNIEKKIIAEKFIETSDNELPNDYKIYCFHGIPKYIMSCEERIKNNAKFYYFDLEGNLLPYSDDSIAAINEKKQIALPDNFTEMIKIAKKLSKDFEFVRVDLYSEFEKIIFGELTFTPGAGVDSERIPEVDLLLGELLNLERKS